MANDKLGIFVPLEVDFRVLRKDLRKVREESKKAGDQAGADLSHGIAKGSEEASSGLKGLLEGLTGVALIIGTKFSAGLRGAAGLLRTATLQIVDFTTLGLLAAAKGLKSFAEALEQSNGAMRHVAPAVRVASSGITGFVKLILIARGAVTGLELAAAAASAGLIIAGHRAAAGAAPGWNRVRTILGDTQNAFKDLQSQVELLGASTGQLEQAPEAFYQILSALPQLVERPTEALEVLRVSLLAAQSGFVDTASSAADAITSIMNAFDLGTDQAERIADALFKTQDLGKTTVGEIADSIAKVGPLVASLGGDFEDVLAVIATITPTGTETSEALTQLRAALANLLNPTAEAKQAAKDLGIQFSAEAVQAKGLAGFLEDIIAKTQGNPEVLSRFFGSVEGLQLLVALSKRTDEFDQKLRQIQDSAGKTSETAGIMSQSWTQAMDRLHNEGTVSLRLLGRQFEDFGVEAADSLTKVYHAINKVLTALLQQRTTRHGLLFGDFFIELDKKEREFEATTWARLKRFLGFAPAPDPRAAQRDAAEAERRRQEAMGLLFPHPLAPLPPRPAEPISIEYSQGKIDELERARQAKAVADLARTGDMKAYEAAVRATQQAVNDLVISEMERLRQEGVSESEIAKLAASYHVLRDELKKTDRQQASLTDNLASQLAQLTATAADDAALQLRRLEAEFEDAFGGKIPEEARAGIEQLRRNLELGGILEDFRGTFDELSRLKPSPEALKDLQGLAEAVRAQRDALDPALERWHEFDELLTSIQNQIQTTQADALVAPYQDAFSRRIDELRELLARGLIDEKTFEQQGELAGEALKRGILAIIEQLRKEGKLSDEVKKALLDAADAATQAGGGKADGDAARQKRIQDARELARTIEQSARGAIQLAEAFGLVNSEAAQALESVAQLGAAVADIVASGGTDAGAILSALGAVATLVSMLKGQSKIELVQEMIRLRDALEKLRSAVLSDISGKEREQLTTAAEGINERIAAGGSRFSGTLELSDAEREAVIRIKKFVEDATGFAPNVLTRGGNLDVEAWQKLIDAFMSLDVGAFGKDLEGRLDALDFVTAQLGDEVLSATERMKRFIATIREFAPELADQIQAALDKGGPEAAQALINDLSERLAANDQSLFAAGGVFEGLTGEEARRVLEEGNDYLRQLVEDTGAGGGSTRSFQRDFAVTEVTAQRMFGVLTTANVLLEGIRANTAATVAALGGEAPAAYPYRPQPDPTDMQAPGEAPPPDTIQAAGSGASPSIDDLLAAASGSATGTDGGDAQALLAAAQAAASQPAAEFVPLFRSLLTSPVLAPSLAQASDGGTYIDRSQSESYGGPITFEKGSIALSFPGVRTRADAEEVGDEIGERMGLAIDRKLGRRREAETRIRGRA